jgi:hypothetical protein
LLSGLPGGGNRADQMLLRSHLLSLDMLARLDAELHLRRAMPIMPTIHWPAFAMPMPRSPALPTT